MADLNHPITGNEDSNLSSKSGLFLKQGTAATFAGVLVLPNVASSLHAVNKDSRIKMEILGLTGETIALTGSVDGTAYSASLIPLDATTGGYAASGTLANGQYIFPATWAFTHYKAVKSSATETCAIAIAYNTAPK